jgi:hypothetical protein
MRIYYTENDNALRIYNRHPSDDYIREIAINNKFIKMFSKEFQAKAIFMSFDKLTINIYKEVEKSILNKIVELGIFNKLEVELPKLILKDLK